MSKTRKGEIILLSIVALLVTALIIAWPHTDLGKSLAEDRRQTAINYLNATAGLTDKAIIEQRKKLIEKYGLENIYGENGTANRWDLILDK